MTAEEEIITAEERLRQAVLNSDVHSLDDLIAEDVLFVDPSGQLLSKARDLEAHQSGLLKVLKMELLEQQIQLLGDVVVVVSLCSLTGSYNSAAFAGDFRYLRVWQRKRTGWRIVAGHCNMVAPAS